MYVYCIIHSILHKRHNTGLSCVFVLKNEKEKMDEVLEVGVGKNIFMVYYRMAYFYVELLFLQLFVFLYPLIHNIMEARC